MKHEYISYKEEQILITHAESYRDCLRLIYSDFYRFSGSRVNLLKLFFYTFSNSAWSYVFWLRLTSYKNGWFWPFARFILYLLAEHTHVHISYKCRIGYGLYIGHGIDMIVNPNAIIGNNVNLSQFLNIGSNSVNSAIIGNNVYIGPHVCIVGPVYIGSNVTIGAGSVVVKDIPQMATAVGNPCKPVNFDNPRKCIGNLWPLPEISN